MPLVNLENVSVYDLKKNDIEFSFIWHIKTVKETFGGSIDD